MHRTQTQKDLLLFNRTAGTALYVYARERGRKKGREEGREMG